MTEGRHGEEPLTPEEEAEVARLLSEAGGPVRMPDDVAARLGGVLAELQGERSTETESQVVELHARRRWPKVLLAAAAVVIGGYAVGTAATEGTLSGSEDSLSAGDGGAAGEDTAAADQESGDAALDDPAGADESAGKDRAKLSVPEAAGERSSDDMALRTVRLRSDRLEAGVRRALEVLDTSPAAGLSLDLEADPACPPPPLGKRERFLPVRYDGGAAVLVVAPERRDTVEVTVWSCAGEQVDGLVLAP
jgi:hypothetical protein